MQGINIFSGEQGLGAALTNPTELARRKGSISERYSVTFRGRNWPDIESAYHFYASENERANDECMAELIAEKFRQHPALKEQVRQQGGKKFLLNCSHFTNAKSERAKSWEGQGETSRFIRNLIRGYELSEETVAVQEQQYQMF